MKKRNDIITEVCELGDGFFAELVDDKANAAFHALVYHERYLTRMPAFTLLRDGCPIKTLEEFAEFVGPKLPEHVKMYQDEYMND